MNQNNFAYGTAGTSIQLTNVVATAEYEAETTYINCNQCGFKNICRSTTPWSPFNNRRSAKTLII